MPLPLRRTRTQVLAACAAAAIITACASSRPSAGSADIGEIDWRLVELGGVPAGPEELTRRPWLRFSTDSGQVSGNAGCNRFSGSFTRDGMSLRFGPMMSTKMACADDALNRQEQGFLSALSAADRYERAGDTLIVMRASDRLAKLVR